MIPSCVQIDLFTNVSQIYGCFFPQDLITIHFINMYLHVPMVFQYLESTLHTLVVATSDKLSGCQEQPFVNMVCIKLMNPSIEICAWLSERLDLSKAFEEVELSLTSFSLMKNC